MNETTEEATVSVSSSSGGGGGGGGGSSRPRSTPSQDPTPIEITFPATQSITEGDTNTVLNIPIVPPALTESITITITSTGTATINEDYTLQETITLTSETPTQLNVTIIGDNSPEATETITLAYGTDTANVEFTREQTVITITDDDQATFSVTAASASINEGEDAVFTISALEAPERDVQFNYRLDGTTTAGTDYTHTSTTGTITPDQTSADITIQLADDLIVENDETLIFTLTNADNVPTGNKATVTVTDNDQGIFSVTAASQTINEGENAVFTITPSETPQSDVQFSYMLEGTTTAGEDYTHTPPATTGTITPSQPNTEITIQLTEDLIVEDDETLTLRVMSLDDSTFTSETTVTVTDNDQATFSVTATSASINEGENAVFTISTTETRTRNVQFSYTLSGNTTAGTDYTHTPATHTIMPDQTNTEITIQLENDLIVEDDETLIFTLTSDTDNALASNQVIVTVTDNDQAVLSVTAVNEIIHEGGEAMFNITVPETRERVVQFSYTLSGTANPDEDYMHTPTSGMFMPEENSVIITIRTTDDIETEGEENITFSLTSTTDNINPGENQATVNISSTVLSPFIEEIEVVDGDGMTRTVYTHYITVTEATRSSVLRGYPIEIPSARRELIREQATDAVTRAIEDYEADLPDSFTVKLWEDEDSTGTCGFVRSNMFHISNVIKSDDYCGGAPMLSEEDINIRLGVVLQHEMFHTITFFMTRGSFQMPLWYAEGFAEVFEPRQEGTMPIIRFTYRVNTTEQIILRFSSYKLGIYIIDRYLTAPDDDGSSIVTNADLMNLSRRVGNGENFWDAFEDETGISQVALEETINSEICLGLVQNAIIPGRDLYRLIDEDISNGNILSTQIVSTGTPTYQNPPANTFIRCSEPPTTANPTYLEVIGNWDFNAQTHSTYPPPLSP